MSIFYQATVLDVVIRDRRFDGVLVDLNGEQNMCEVGRLSWHLVDSRPIKTGSPGLGGRCKKLSIRGTPYNTGEVLKRVLETGADQIGDPTQCHAVAIDGRAPEYDGGIVTRVDCVPFSIVVNQAGHRFYDEGEDVWPKRYAIWGRLVAKQPAGRLRDHRQ